jgi:hypothetical protein
MGQPGRVADRGPATSCGNDDPYRRYVTERVPQGKKQSPPSTDLQQQDAVCHRHWERMAEWAPDKTREADRRISAALIPLVWSLYGDSDDQVRAHLVRFRQAKWRHLHFVEEEHADDKQVAPLLHQPELPLILDRLEADPTGLREAWPATLPRIWLEALAEAWGSPL